MIEAEEQREIEKADLAKTVTAQSFRVARVTVLGDET